MSGRPGSGGGPSGRPADLRSVPPGPSPANGAFRVVLVRTGQDRTRRARPHRHHRPARRTQRGRRSHRRGARRCVRPVRAGRRPRGRRAHRRGRHLLRRRRPARVRRPGTPQPPGRGAPRSHGADATSDPEADDRGGRGPRRRGRDGAGALVRPTRDRRDGDLRGLLSSVGRAAHRRRHGPPATRRRSRRRARPDRDRATGRRGRGVAHRARDPGRPRGQRPRGGHRTRTLAGGVPAPHHAGRPRRGTAGFRCSARRGAAGRAPHRDGRPGRRWSSVGRPGSRRVPDAAGASTPAPSSLPGRRVGRVAAPS